MPNNSLKDTSYFSKNSLLYLFTTIFFLLIYFLIIKNFINFNSSIILSIIVSAFMTISVVSFKNAGAKYQDLKILRNSINKNINDLVNGERIAVFGNIKPQDNLALISPITRSECLLYSYSIYHLERRGNRKNRHNIEIVDFYGDNLIPSIINSNIGNIKVLSYPSLISFESKKYHYLPENNPLFQNFIQYAQHNTFQHFDAADIFNIKNIIDLNDEAAQSKSGKIRHDIQYGQNQNNLANHSIEETIIPINTPVCAIGIWSKENQGLTSNQTDQRVTIIKGNREETIQIMSKEWKKNIITGIGILIFINLFLGFVLTIITLNTL